jgi:Protein of unknown function (DUF2605)
MTDSPLSEKALLKNLLEPLLEDFQYWFAPMLSLLENEKMAFLTAEQQNDLLLRVTEAQKEVSTAQMLFKVTDGEVGLETAAMIPWHKLVHECWKVSRLYRQQPNGRSADINPLDT